MAPRLNPARREHGIAVVELALLLPLVMLLLVGLIEYGSMFLKAQHVAEAARHGARVGITPSATAGSVNAAVGAVMTAAGLDATAYVVTLSPADPSSLAAGETFSVTVAVPYANLELTGFPLPAPTFVQSQTTMAKEGS